jgi:CDP-diacylglycerol---serine O-phosphatidyltransferase
MSIKKNIPNAITLGNLFCGCLALVQAFEGNLVWAAYFVGIAAVLDFLDGFIARLLNVQSAIGKDLDSLADMVTFGVVPGVVMMMLIKYSLVFESQAVSPIPGLSLENLPYFGFIIIIFSCVRLAIFNNDTRQTDNFIGLPTPANSILICSLPLLLQLDNGIAFQRTDMRLMSLILNAGNLCILTGFLSLLLVTELPLFSLKFKDFSWSKNKVRYIFLVLCIIMLILFRYAGITLSVMAYILLSFVNNIFSKKEV